MKSLFLIFLLLSIGVASAQEDKPTQAFSGCYELKVEGWHPARTYSDQFLPRRFQLTGQATKLGLVPKNLDSNIRYDLAVSSWYVRDQFNVEIIWSTGFVGWTVLLNRFGSNEFRGTAKFQTDTEREPSESRTVVAHAIDCKGLGDESSKKPQ